MKRKYMKKYLVSYFYTTKDDAQGWGHTTFTVKGPRPLLVTKKTKEQILDSDNSFKRITIMAISEVK